jgi:hypothetical protein
MVRHTQRLVVIGSTSGGNAAVSESTLNRKEFAEKMLRMISIVQQLAARLPSNPSDISEVALSGKPPPFKSADIPEREWPGVMALWLIEQQIITAARTFLEEDVFSESAMRKKQGSYRSAVPAHLSDDWSSCVLVPTVVITWILRVYEAFSLSVKLVKFAFSKLDAAKMVKAQSAWLCPAVESFLKGGVEEELFVQFGSSLRLFSSSSSTVRVYAAPAIVLPPLAVGPLPSSLSALELRSQPTKTGVAGFFHSVAQKFNRSKPEAHAALSAVLSSPSSPAASASSPAPNAAMLTSSISAVSFPAQLGAILLRHIRDCFARDWYGEPLQGVHDAEMICSMLQRVGALGDLTASVVSLATDLVHGWLDEQRNLHAKGEHHGAALSIAAAGLVGRLDAQRRGEETRSAIGPWLPRTVQDEVRIAVFRVILPFMARPAILQGECFHVVSMLDTTGLVALCDLLEQCRLANANVPEPQRVPFDLMAAFAAACHSCCNSTFAAVLGQQFDNVANESSDGMHAQHAASQLSSEVLGDLLSSLLTLFRDVKSLVSRSCADRRQNSFGPELLAAFSTGLSRVLRPHANLCAAVVTDQMSRSRRTPEDMAKVFEFIETIGRCIADCDAFTMSVVTSAEARLLDMSNTIDMASGADCVFDDERALAGLLRRVFQACTFEVRRFALMLSDMEGSRALSEKLAATLPQRGDAMSLSLRILSSNVWSPPPRAVRLALPPALDNMRVISEKLYKRSFVHRHLQWAWVRSSAAVRTMFTSLARKGGSGGVVSVSYELLMPMSVAVLLLSMDERGSDTLAANEMEPWVDVQHKQVRSTLARLEHLKLITLISDQDPLTDGAATSSDPKVARKNTVLRSITLNRGFTHQSKKLNLLPKTGPSAVVPAAAGDGRTGGGENPTAIDDRRKWALQAAVVRKMKSEKVLDFNGICEGVAQLLRNNFVPTVAEIKRAIEQLLEKEYLERDEQDRNKYHYKAQ